MEFKHPVVVYTAATNLEAHVIAEMLRVNGVEAHAVEDQSGVSLWALGTISQFHQPNVWVDKSQILQATQLVQAYEENRRKRDNPAPGSEVIQVVCEECGAATVFPVSLNGTTQECSQCQAYVDVGELPWEDDFGDPDDQST